MPPRPGERSLIPVSVSGQWGYADRKGNLVIPPQFTFAGEFVEGLARVNVGAQGSSGAVGGEWGYIDPGGQWKIPLRFDQADDFSEGLAAVNTGARVEYWAHEDQYYMRGSKWRFINAGGGWGLEPQFDGASSFSGGLAPVSNGAKSFFVDRTGACRITGDFRCAFRFSEGRAAVEVGGLWGYVDGCGNWVAPPRFDTAGSFSEGLSAGFIRQPRRRVFVDLEGREAFAAPEGCGYVGEFSEGLVWASWGSWTIPKPRAVRSERGGCGYLGRTGQWVIEPRFESADGFRDGLAGVSLNGRYLLIDAAGAVIWRE